MIISILVIFIIFVVGITIAWFWYFQKEKPSSEILYKEGLKALKKNNIEKAEKLLLKSAESPSASKDTLYQLGLVYLKSGKYEEAKEMFEKVLKLSPKDFGALFNMGVVLQNQQSYEQANDYYIRALKENPDDGECNLNFAIMNFEQKNYDVATEYFEKSANLLPEEMKPTASFHLLKCKNEDPKIETDEEQKTIIEEYLEFETTNSQNLPKDFHISVAKAYAKGGKIKEAFERCQKSLEIDSNNIDTYKQMALMQLIKKDFVGAKKTLSTALSLQPKDEELHNLLSYVLCQQSNICEAKKCREKYQELIKNKFKLK